MKLLTLILLLVPAASAQNPLMQRYTVEDGLSQNLVTAIAQDTRGFLWFGTKDGLNVFDGYSFRIFRSSLSDTASLQSNYISALWSDSAGTMWVGTLGGGLSRYDEASGTFHTWRYTTGNPAGLQSDFINGIIGGVNGSLIISTTEGGIALFDTAADQFSPLIVRSGPSFPNRFSRACLLDGDSVVWIGTNLDGLYAYHLSEKTIRHYPSGKGSSGPTHPRIKDVCRDGQGRFWIGHETGFDEFDPVTGNFTPHRILIGGVPAPGVEIRGIGGNQLFVNAYGQCGIYNIATRQFKPYDVGHEVTSTFTDRSGILWFSVGGFGVLKYDPLLERFGLKRSAFWNGLYGESILRAKRAAGIPPEARIEPHTVLRDTNGVLWFEEYLRSVVRYDERSGKADVIPLNDAAHGIRFDHLTRMFVDRTNTVWGAVGFHLLKYLPERRAFKEFALSQFVPPRTILVNSTEYSSVTALWKDAEGILWLGTPGSGLIRFDERTNDVRLYSPDPKESASLSNGFILSLCADPVEPEVLWIGTDGGGLNRFDTRRGSVTARFSTSDALPNDVVYAILPDRNRKLWMSSNSGLFVFDPAAMKVTARYDANDGLQSNEFNRYEFWKDNAGRLYFGGINGWNSFNPDSVTRRTFDPPVVLTDLKVMNVSVARPRPQSPLTSSLTFTDRIVLQPDQTMISFEFASLDFAAPNKNRYRYAMEGWNGDWIDAGDERTATYTNLDPGEYRFVVQGSNSDGIWSTSTASMQIVVLPPFYRTWWFQWGTALLLVTGLTMTVRSRFQRLRKEQDLQQSFSRRVLEQQEQDRERIAAELHDSLGQNLLVVKNRAVLGIRGNPDRASADHFDAISSIISDSLKEVRSIAHNLRPYQLDSLGISETLRSAVKKLSDSSSVIITASIDEIDGLLAKEQEINLFRIVQECFNNIIKHSGAARAAISVQRSAGGITVTVTDNGKGIPESATNSEGFGMMGIRQRVKMLGGTMTVASAINNGTTISITITL